MPRVTLHSLDVSFTRHFYVFYHVWYYLLLLLFAPLIYLFNPSIRLRVFSVFDFEQKDQILKRVQIERRMESGDASQTKHDVEDTQSMANTYSLLRTSPRRDIAALPSNRMR